MTDAQERLQNEFGVSRETMERLEAYVDIVRRWTVKINLVSRKSVSEIWERHVLDSAQLFQIALNSPHAWADLGSGGGFPGVVVAILSHGAGAPCKFHLVESDLRKATFLRAALREAGVSGLVHADRIEEIAPIGADVISARALAPLSELLPHVKRHGTSNCIGVFPKGQGSEVDIKQALKNWSFTCRRHPSITDQNAQILELGAIRERRAEP